MSESATFTSRDFSYRNMTKLRKRRNWVTNYASLTDIGLAREENQDCWGVFPDEKDAFRKPKGQLFVVADGMGAHARGAEAAKLAVEYVQETYFADPSENIVASLKVAFEAANEKIVESWQSDESFERMGTTCTALVLTEGGVYIAHVGDSCAYRVTKNNIEKLTEDHTHVAELQRRGVLTEKEAKKNPRRSELVRAMGMMQQLEVDIIEGPPLRAGDIYVLCTDGLADVSVDEIKLTVQAHQPKQACRELIDLENNRSGADNTTVQVIKVGREESTNRIKMAHSDEDVHKNLLKVGVFILAFILLFAIVRKRSTLWDKFLGLILKPEVEQVVRAEPEKEPDTRPEEPAIEQVDTTTIVNVPPPAREEPQVVASGPPINTAPRPRPRPSITDFPRTIPDRPAPSIEPKPIPLNIAGWDFPGLVEYKDYTRTRNGFSLLETVGNKKAIHDRSLSDFDFQVTFDDIGDLKGGQVGTFVGYQRKASSELFYEVYLKQNGDFALVKHYDNKRRRLRPLDLQLKRVNKGPLHLRIRCVGPWIIVYANNQLVNAWQNDNEFIKGKVGFSVGSEKNVAFSNIKVVPMSSAESTSVLNMSN